MDLRELETYRLQDAVKFNDQLNPRLWGPDEHLLPEVKAKLQAIADDFREFLGIDVEVKDITVSGSNAAYTYTPHSDIDLHLVVDLPRADESDVYRELFDAKKYQYNDQHDFKIGGYDVELYVQDARKPHHSQGIYSLTNDDWVKVPNRRRPDVDDISVRSKYEDIGQRIDAAIESSDLARMEALAAKIRDMRQAGLDAHGEFGPENLAFKVLRGNGTLDRLRAARKAAQDQAMSLEERRKKKSRKKKTRYGYGAYWFPGYGYYGQTGEVSAADGGDGGGGESIREGQETQQDTIQRFMRSCGDFLGMEQVPELRLRQDPEWSRRNGTFGRYTASPARRIELATAGRHIVDILRTLAHEMTHARQDEVMGLPDHAGETGSEYEDSANAMAGRIMRHWAESEPEMFAGVDLEEDWRQRAAGVAAAACIAGTPGCATTDTAGTSGADVLRGIQNIGRTAQALRGYGANDARNELSQELGNWLRRQGGHTDQPTNLPLPDIRQQQEDLELQERAAPHTYTDDQLDQIAVRYAQQHGVPIDLVRHVMQKETGGYPAPLRVRAVSPKGAIGVMQLMPDTADELGVDPKDPVQNIEGGVRYLRRMLNAFGNDPQLAMMAYNWGPGRVGAWIRGDPFKGQTGRFRPRDPRRVPRETRNYIVGYTGSAPRTQVARAPEKKQTAPASRPAPPPPPRRAAAPSQQPLDRKTLRQQELERIEKDLQRYGRPSPPAKRRDAFEASGYIPTEKERNDPRFSMALTRDIHPGETGRQANKLGLKTDSQGRPALLMKKLNNLLESVKAGLDEGYDQRKADAYNRAIAAGRSPADAERIAGITDADADYYETGMDGRLQQSQLTISRRRPGDRVIDQWNKTSTREDQQSVKEGLDVPTHSPDALAKKHGVSIDKIKAQLAKGIRVEMEHTTDRATAREIALDHLAEFPDYYDRLARAETMEDCWDGYRQQGMKKKGDRMVPNCVKVTEDDEDLMEVKMSPAEFQKFLKSPAAEGIRAGFEAELIFRNTQGDVGGGGESDLDWDADEGATDIDDIINFFTSGQEPMSLRRARRLQEELQEQFMDWVREQFANEYFDQDRFMSWAEENVWPDNEDEYRERARANLDDEDASDEAVEREAVTLFRDDVEQDWDRSGAWYERASEELFDEYAGDADQYEWLYSAGLSMMSDVAQEYNLDWPYYRESDYGDGERDWTTIGKSLESATGMPVRVSGSYKGAARRPGQYIIEPDSSLEDGRDDADDFGLEIVSPPLPLPETIEQLKRVIAWANGPGDAYTNEKTGLHMGVSLPYKGGEVDPIKLILFMGDQDLLKQFERLGNSYTESAYKRLENKIRSMKNAGPKQIAGVMDLMKNNLIELAERELKQGVLGNKYVSVNPHDGYIEFRGPGNNYLAKEDEIDGVLENTMLRLAYAMSIAGSPELYRKEYAKKLYKVLTKDDPANPFMKLFSDYSAGDLSAEELKRQWADTVLQAERGDVDDTPWAEPGEYEVYDKDSGTPGDRDSFTVIDTFQSNSDENAMVIAQEKWSGRGVNFGVRAKVAEPEEQKPKSRRAELAQRVTRSTKDVGEQLWRVNHHSSVRWITARSQAEAVKQAIQQDRAFNSAETRARIATDLEKAQWNLDQERQRERNAGRDAAQIRARLGVPVPAGGGGKTYDVIWDEVEGDTMRFKRVRIQASSAEQAMQMIRDQVEARGAELRDIRAEERSAEELQRVYAPQRNQTTQPAAQQAAGGGAKTYEVTWDEVEGDTTRTDSVKIQARSDQHAMQMIRDAVQARGAEVRYIRAEEFVPDYPEVAAPAQQPQGEWTGRWLIRNANTGELLHAIHGIGNSQSDANRHAQRWVQQTRFDDPVEVVPEMR